MQTRLWAEISVAALDKNIRQLSQRVAPESQLTAVVKANAYGHGLVPIARLCQQLGVERIAVATLEEAQILRHEGLSATLHILSPLLPEEAEAAVRANTVPFVSSRAFFTALEAAAASVPFPPCCFLMVDTGMGREGMAVDEALALLAQTDSPVEIVGLATHFASADEDDLTPTDEQLAVWREFLDRAGPRAHGLLHSLNNSPALLRYPTAQLHRVGAVLYGIAPYPGALEGTGIVPVLSLKARVTLVRSLPVGATLGYGRTYTLTRPSRIATVPAGYGDGYLRRLSNRGFVLIHGQRCPILGRVSMDQCQVDVTDVPEVAIGDLVTLIGSDGDETITAAELGEWAETTCHEPTTLLSLRVPRLYTEGGTGIASV